MDRQEIIEYLENKYRFDSSGTALVMIHVLKILKEPEIIYCGDCIY